MQLIIVSTVAAAPRCDISLELVFIYFLLYPNKYVNILNINLLSIPFGWILLSIMPVNAQFFTYILLSVFLIFFYYLTTFYTSKVSAK